MCYSPAGAVCLAQICGYTSPCKDLIGASQFLRPLAGYLAPEVAGLGGTNLHQPRNELFVKHNLLITRDLYFETP